MVRFVGANTWLTEQGAIFLPPMDYIIGLGEENDPRHIPLVTRLGWKIPNVKKLFRRAPESMLEAARIHKEAHPTLKERSLTADYNCVGLVFASRRTCIDAEHLNKILADDGYQRIPVSQVVIGDLVLYRDAEGNFAHVGIVAEHKPNLERATWTTLVLSQWGAEGEYFHDIDDVDMRWLQKPREFWSEKI